MLAGLASTLTGPAFAAKAVPPPPITSPVKPAAKTAAAPSNSPLLPGASSKEPININAAKLDYFDKEQKLIYTGDVVAVQGDSTLKSSKLTIFLQKDPQTAAAGAATPAAPASPSAPGPGAGSSVSHMEAEGPVTMISKDQIGTGDHGSYDKAENKVYLNGHVTLSQGTNVTQGDRLVYDMTSGQAQVFSDKPNGGRVSSVFTPGAGAAPGAQPGPTLPAAKPAKTTSAPKRKAAKGAKPTPEQSGDAAVQ